MTRAVARAELLGSALLFGVMTVLARRLTRGADPFTPGQLTAVRFVVGALVSVAFFSVRPGTYRPVNYRLLLTRGLSGGIVVVLYFYALRLIPAGEASLLYHLFPILGTILSYFAFGERPTVHLALGILAATAGVALVLGGGSVDLGLGPGELLALGASFFAATSAVTIRAMRGTDNAPTIFFFFCLGGLPVALPFALDPWPSAPATWAVAIAMGLASWGAQVLMTEAYGALSIAEAAAWLQLTPVASFLLAVPLLGEAVTADAMAGTLLGVGGVAYATVKGHARTGPARAPVPRA